MEAYPLLVRKRIIELYEREGKSTREIAELFGICRSGTRRVKQYLRERGTLAPRLGKPGRKPKMTEDLQHQIREYIAAHPDCTRAELKAALNLPVSLQAISEWLKKLGLVLKKVAPRRRAGSARCESRPSALARSSQRRPDRQAGVPR